MRLGAVGRLRVPWSLRARVVAGVVSLLALLAVAIGTTSVGLLNSQLVGRLDVQLTDTLGRAGGRVDPNRPGGGDPCSETEAGRPALNFLLPGQGAGAVAVLVCGGTAYVSGYIDANGTARQLTGAQATTLVRSAGAHPDSVALGSLGEYRVAARQLSTGAVLINALPMAEVRSTTAQLTLIIAVVTLLAIALAVALGLLVVGVALRPLTRVAATATRVSELPLEDESTVAQRVPEEDSRASTEVGRVGAALNRLLDRVESALTARTASEQKLRRFVADASHELRTPLASIRGYAELSRRFDDQLPPDVRHSLERIGSESVRMTSLVQDLLLLARLDAGSPIVHEPVDLGRLLIDAVSDAHAAGPDHQWRLELPHSGSDGGDDGEEADETPGEVIVLGDERSLHQVLANLLGNALTHTPHGTVVTATLTTTGSDAIIEVADDGPGIPEELRSRLFERFVRGDDSRSRAAGSTGLGLSIAEALVAAHSGELSVESEPGRTVFRVRLPLRAAPAPVDPVGLSPVESEVGP